MSFKIASFVSLDLNKIESNKMELYENVYNLNEEITNMCKITQTRIGDKNIKFTLSIADDIPYELVGDKSKVKEIVNNILDITKIDEGKTTVNLKPYNLADLALQHFDLLLKYKGEYTATREIRKHVSWYVKGLPGASFMRDKINTVETAEEFYKIVFFWM